MMLINLIWFFVKQQHEDTRITFWVELDGNENFDRLLKALPRELHSNSQIKIRQLPLKITSIDNSSILRKALRLYNKFYKHPKSFKKLGITSVIILGGDDISEYYKKWMILSDLYRIYRYSRKFPTTLAGQTIGPFRGFRERLAAKCLSRTVIYSRDELTFSYLKKQLKLPEQHIRSSADLCFPELPGQNAATGILESYKLQADNYITLVPGGFFTLYTNDRGGYINSWARMIAGLLDKASFKKMRIALLPHVTRPEDDREIIGAIYKILIQKGEDPERFCMIEEELMPHQLRHILGNGYLTISSRMHAALSTFQMKRPAIALGYSVKYEGVIGLSIQCPELVVHCTSSLLSDPEGFTFEVLQKTSYIETNYQQLITHLESRIPRLKAMAEDQIKEICSTAISDQSK